MCGPEQGSNYGTNRVGNLLEKLLRVTGPDKTDSSTVQILNSNNAVGIEGTIPAGVTRMIISASDGDAVWTDDPNVTPQVSPLVGFELLAGVPQVIYAADIPNFKIVRKGSTNVRLNISFKVPAV